MDFFSSKSQTPAEVAKQLIGKEVTPLVTQPVELDHKHEWEMLSKTQAPARKDAPPPTITDKELLDRMLFGVTVYLWECILCRTLRKETVLGSDVTQLDELIDKADRFGPQYIQRVDGTTFVLGKYTPPQQSTVPMR